MRHAMTCCFAAIALLAGSSNLQAQATWTLGALETQICRSSGAPLDIAYCHNCRERAGANPYVSWTWVANCNGQATNRRARGSLSCTGSDGNETAQRAAIVANATAALPASTVNCPAARRRR